MKQNSKDNARQRGMSLWSWMYVLGTLGLMLLVGIQSVPVYMNNFDIRSTMEWAANQPELYSAPASGIHKAIQRRFDSGYVTNIKARDIKVKRVKEGRRLQAKYDVRRPLFFNMILLFDFDETVIIKKKN